MTGVSVALPVTRLPDPAVLDRAVACLRSQTYHPLDIILVLNGADPATTASARRLTAQDARTRLIEFPTPNLAAALNAALHAARYPLVARMDADDTCPPGRVARQAAFLAEHPGIAGVGTAFDRVGPDGRLLETVRPPRDPAEIRWRLHLGNLFCHGSMMLRRDMVLEAGGYDAAFTRAQDYDLWLRLARVHAHALANLPEVLYRHTVRDPSRPSAPSDTTQAGCAARALLDAWRRLPPIEARHGATELERLLADVHAGPLASAATIGPLSSLLTRSGPSRETLMAWLFAHTRAGTAPAPVYDACRLSRIREVGARLRADGVRAVILWGAGAHTGFLLSHRAHLGIDITGIVDDHRAGETRHGFPVRAPNTLIPNDNALLSSDCHEDALWTASEPHRRRGVNVWRLYLGDADGPP